MKVIKKEKQIKEVEVTIESYSLCDKCNSKIKKGSYDDFGYEFTHKTVSEYPEGGSGEKQEMKLCQKCASELVTLLRLNGCRVNDLDWYW